MLDGDEGRELLSQGLGFSGAGMIVGAAEEIGQRVRWLEVADRVAAVARAAPDAASAVEAVRVALEHVL